jgi:hypothetical protein
VPYINQAGGGGTGAISGVIVSGTAAAGDSIIASSAAAGSWVFPPGHEFGYDQITTNVTVTSTTEATGTSVIAAAAHTFDGAPVVAEFFAPSIEADNGAASDLLIVSLFEGATQIGRIVQVRCVVTAAIALYPAYAALRFTPSAASHTYSVTAFCTTNNATATVFAGATGTGNFVPAFLRFTKA